MSDGTTTNTAVTNEDRNNDGVLDQVTTTVTTTDYSNDGIIDVTETNVTVLDGNTGDAIESDITILVDNASGSFESQVTFVQGSEDSKSLVLEIQKLQEKIKCSRFQGKGTMDDYANVFKKIQQYFAAVGDSNVEITIDTENLDNFAEQAKIFSEMFEEILIKFNKVSSVDDSVVLKKIRDDMVTITKMYENIDKFKAIVTGTSSLQIPQTIIDCTEVLNNINSDIACSLSYINYFVDSSAPMNELQLQRSQLSGDDKKALEFFENSIQVWIDMVNNDGTVAMSTNAYVKAFKNRIASFGTHSEDLAKYIKLAQKKLAGWKRGEF